MKMKRKNLLYAPIPVLFVAFVFFIYEEFAGKILLETTSPSGEYTVKFQYDKSPFTTLLFESRVFFGVLKDGKPLTASQRMTSYDGFSPGFLERFPDYFWTSNSVLEFVPSGENASDAEDKIFVTNKSTKSIRYLRIGASALFLAFDLDQNQSLILNVSQSRSMSWIEANGQFKDGTQIELRGINFLTESTLPRSSHCYCIRIDDDGLTIGSPMIEGFDSTRTAPILSNCGE
jgi:hypothetical protein